MLIKFKVKNFMSFKEEQVLDLTAVSYKNLKEHVLEIPRNKIVKTMAIYGATASGKSNLIKALYSFETFIYHEFYEVNERNDDIEEVFNSNFATFFGNEEESEFELELFLNEKIYRYGTSLNYLNNKVIVNREWLFVDNRLVFERSEDLITLGSKYNRSLKELTEVRKDRLFIGVIEYFAKGSIREVVDELKFYFERQFNVLFDRAIDVKTNFIPGLIEIDGALDLIKRLVVEANLGICDVVFKDNKVSFIHSNGSNTYIIDMENESSGTIRYFIFVKYLVYLIKTGGVLIVDDLTSKLNHNLVKLILDIFQSEENKKAGLIFTTNDLYLLGSKQFRKDEIMLVEKVGSMSHLVPLAKLGLRSDANILGDYVSGKYTNYHYLEKEDFDF